AAANAIRAASILRYTGLVLSDEVGAEVGGVRVDPAAELGEERDERRAEAEANDGEGSLLGMRESAVRDEHREHADERETDDEDPRDRTAAQRNAQRIRDAVLRRGRGPEVGLDRDEHADDPRRHRARCADDERDGGLDWELPRCNAGGRLDE